MKTMGVYLFQMLPCYLEAKLRVTLAMLPVFQMLPDVTRCYQMLPTKCYPMLTIIYI